MTSHAAAQLALFAEESDAAPPAMDVAPSPEPSPEPVDRYEGLAPVRLPALIRAQLPPDFVGAWCQTVIRIEEALYADGYPKLVVVCSFDLYHLIAVVQYEATGRFGERTISYAALAAFAEAFPAPFLADGWPPANVRELMRLAVEFVRRHGFAHHRNQHELLAFLGRYQTRLWSMPPDRRANGAIGEGSQGVEQ